MQNGIAKHAILLDEFTAGGMLTRLSCAVCTASVTPDSDLWFSSTILPIKICL